MGNYLRRRITAIAQKTVAEPIAEAPFLIEGIVFLICLPLQF